MKQLQLREVWEKHPIRIVGANRCRSCQAPRLVVRSKDGGYVTSNCIKCGNSDTLNFAQFEALDLWVSCPQCQDRMNAVMVPWGNYGFVCDACDVAIDLADLVPGYKEI